MLVLLLLRSSCACVSSDDDLTAPPCIVQGLPLPKYRGSIYECEELDPTVSPPDDLGGNVDGGGGGRPVTGCAVRPWSCVSSSSR